MTQFRPQMFLPTFGLQPRKSPVSLIKEISSAVQFAVKYMNKRAAQICIYKHGSKPKYLLLRQAPLGNGAATAYGDFVHLSNQEMMDKGLDLVLADFQEYHSRDPKHGSVINGFSPEAKKAGKFLRDYDEVIVSFDSESALSLNPVCVVGRSRDSGVVRKEDVKRVSLPTTNAIFFQELQPAFEKCCYMESL